MSRAVKKADNLGKPLYGSALYIGYTLLKSLSFVFTSKLYDWNTPYPDTPNSPYNLNPYQLLFLRSSVSITTLLLWLNVDLKKNVYTGINRTNVSPLAFRTIQGTVSNFINYSVTKYIPASINSVINQLCPILVFVLSRFIFKEQLMCFDSCIMAVNLAAILLTILG